ncbi:MAG: hypothetical protein KC636_05475 [Myxococcales bacterium]|nr:hypothetical protein [Myxococcales bacterium]
MLLVGAALTGCDTAEPSFDSTGTSFRPGWGGTTFNTDNWVSAGARDIHEFSLDGTWVTNQFGFETRLAGIVIEDPQYGVVETDPGAGVTSGKRVVINTPQALGVTVFGPNPQSPKHMYGGEDVIGLELHFEVRYHGGPVYESWVRVVDHALDEGGGSSFAFHKIDPETGGDIAPICEIDSNGAKMARVFPNVSIDGVNGTVVDLPNRVQVACLAAAPGKTSLYGYLPQFGAESYMLANRVVRADYCADGYPYTYPGNTLIMYDNFRPEVTQVHSKAELEGLLEEGQVLEAIWGPNGILCIGTPRVSTLAAEDVVCPIKFVPNEPAAKNWKPPSCDDFVDPSPEDIRIYSVTAG